MLKLPYNYHKDNSSSSVLLNTWSVILWAKALRPSCSRPRSCDLRKLGWAEGAERTFSFCQRLRQPSFHLIVNDRVVGGIRTLFSLDLSPTLLIPCTITLTPIPSLMRKEPAVRNGTEIIRSLQFTVNWFSHVHVNLWSGGSSSLFCEFVWETKKKSHLIAGYVLLCRRHNFLQTLFLLFKFVTSETIGSFVSKNKCPSASWHILKRPQEFRYNCSSVG